MRWQQMMVRVQHVMDVLILKGVLTRDVQPGDAKGPAASSGSRIV
jgi:hypothetical protein